MEDRFVGLEEAEEGIEEEGGVGGEEGGVGGEEGGREEEGGNGDVKEVDGRGELSEWVSGTDTLQEAFWEDGCCIKKKAVHLS